MSSPAHLLSSMGALRGPEKTEAALAEREAVGSSPWFCKQYTSVGNLRGNCPQTTLIMIAPQESWDKTRVASCWGLAEWMSTLKTNDHFHICSYSVMPTDCFRMLHLFSFLPSGEGKKQMLILTIGCILLSTWSTNIMKEPQFIYSTNILGALLIC